MPGKFSLLVYHSHFFLLRQVSDEVWGVLAEHWEFVHHKIPQSQEKQEERESCRPGAAARAGWSSEMFEHKVPVGFPDINTGSTPTPLPLLNTLTTTPYLSHTHTRTHFVFC